MSTETIIKPTDTGPIAIGRDDVKPNLITPGGEDYIGGDEGYISQGPHVATPIAIEGHTP